MPHHHRSRHGAAAAAAALALALAGCASGEDSTAGGASPSSSGSAPTPTSATGTTSTSAAPTTSTASGTGSSGTGSSGTGSSSTGRSVDSSSPTSGEGSGATSPDPTVSVTPGKDAPQPAAAKSAGIASVDNGAAAGSLSIPAVGLTTKIGPQGLRGGQVNPSPGEVIWFTGYDRVRPGAMGTTVIAGHVVSGGGPDRFAALEQLSKGDGVLLTYPDGSQLRFEVTTTEIVDKDKLTTRPEVWGDNTDTRRIVLVTCDDQLGFREDGHRKANFVAVAELPS